MVCQIFLRWSLLVFVLKQRCKFVFSLTKQKPFQIYINNRKGCYLPERYFRFHWNFKSPQLDEGKCISNCEIYFLFFSKITHIISKYFHIIDLFSVGSDCYEKIGCYRFWPKLLSRSLKAFTSLNNADLLGWKQSALNH